MASVRPSRKRPIRRLSHRHHPLQRRRLGWRGRVTLGAFLLLLVFLGCGTLLRLLAPTANTTRTRFDAIIVLGNPADSDGNPSPQQLARVTEGVREYERGVAPRLILTGGAAHNHFVEAQVMARTAEAQGIPASAIFVEPNALDTIQNACYSARIMKAHGWRTAEVVSSGYHLPRAGIILGHLPIEWRTHAAPSLEPDAYLWAAGSVEALKTMRYTLWSQWRERCEP